MYKNYKFNHIHQNQCHLLFELDLQLNYFLRVAHEFIVWGIHN
jgi:hypothetical protein